jgi:hypothetical protein
MITGQEIQDQGATRLGRKNRKNQPEEEEEEETEAKTLKPKSSHLPQCQEAEEIQFQKNKLKN